MSEEKKSIIKSSSGVAVATMSSRMLGLLRSVLTAAILGGGTLMSAWGMALTVANMFRRLLGEGALGTALVPMLSHIIEEEGKLTARKKLTTIFIALGILLGTLCLIIAAGAFLTAPYIETPRIRLTLLACSVIIPYTFFICLVGVAGAVLNCVRNFFIPALGALLMNIMLIICLLFVIPYFQNNLEAILYSLSVAVIISGVLQLMLNSFLLYREGMFPVLNLSLIKDSATLKEIWQLTLPGFIGASALQISLMVDRILALSISDYAVPSLIYSDRLIYLPIGVFAVSFGAVSLSMMSRSAAKKDINEMVSSLSFAMRQLLFICVPIAVFIFLFSTPIIKVIYMRGEFGELELKETVWAMLFYSTGIPAFAAVKISVSGFYARKDMKTPVKISILCICVNIILNLILMWPLRQGGLALATVISSVLNNVLLLYFLRKDIGKIPTLSFLKTLIFSGALSLLSGFAAWQLFFIVPRLKFHRWISIETLPLLAAGTVFVIIYLLLSVLLKNDEMTELFELFRKRSNIKSKE